MSNQWGGNDGSPGPTAGTWIVVICLAVVVVVVLACAKGWIPSNDQPTIPPHPQPVVSTTARQGGPRG